MKSHILLHDLIAQANQIKSEVLKLKTLSIAELNCRLTDNSWSVLECIEHMNLYGDYYLEAMASAIKSAKPSEDETFNTGWLGNYFAKSMLPKEKLNKMKTFKDKDPIGKAIDTGVIDTFISQQEILIALMEKAGAVSLNKTKVTTSISKLIRMNLGDTFRFFINHNHRHVQQIRNILS